MNNENWMDAEEDAYLAEATKLLDKWEKMTIEERHMLRHISPGIDEWIDDLSREVDSITKKRDNK